MSETDLCKHRQANPEGVEWPEADALEHFLNCMAPAAQQQFWRSLREAAWRGDRCFQQDHDGQREQHGAYIQRLLAGVRETIELLRQPNHPMHSTPLADAANKLEGLIS